MYDVTALGELLIDFASLETDASGYPTMAAHPGGAPGNYLAALSTYGRKTAFLGKVGTDAFGDMLIATMQASGIDIQGIVQDASVFTTLAFVTFDKHGERTFSFARKPGADTRLFYHEISLPMIEQSQVFHFGTLSLTEDPIRDTTRRAVAYAKAQNKLITFDPNLRESLWDNLNDAKVEMLWGLDQADIVKISQEEVSFLWNCDGKKGADIILNTHDVSLVMVTLGARGCYLQNKNHAVTVKAPSVQAVDTTGAGDIFGGAAVSRILNYAKHPQGLTEDELYHIARFAVTAASLSTQRFGGISSIPCEEEVLSFMQQPEIR